MKKEKARYLVIYDNLIEQIKSSSVKKLSVSGISRKYNINRNTADKVLKLLAENGWVRREIGRGTFADGFNDAIRYSINFLYSQNAYESSFVSSYPYVHAGIFEAMQKLGANCEFKVKIFDSAVKREDAIAKSFSGRPGQGIVILDPWNEEILKELHKRKIPYMAYLPPEMASYNSITIDTYQATYRAMEYLIKMSGRKNILFLCSTRDNQWQKSRFKAYCDALKAFNLPLKEKFILEYGMDMNYVPWFVEFVKKHKEVDAVFASNFNFAYETVLIAKAAGIEIPGRLAVISTHDIPKFEKCVPGISAINVSLEGIAEKIFRELKDMIDNGFRENIRLVEESRFIIRGSV
ncbi:MAG: hypothetical protein A2017_03325 [Lentisphaerae bacterium GWF2_44_16]|nr:MAG: hypothetical protein A2017_03325 [Lentisphaerae bacterium GWF2_44_16]